MDTLVTQIKIATAYIVYCTSNVLPYIHYVSHSYYVKYFMCVNYIIDCTIFDYIYIVC